MSKHKKILEYSVDGSISEYAIDTHAHLDRDYDVSSIAHSMKDDKLKKIVAIAGDENSIEDTLEKIDEFNNIFLIAGLHPYDANKYNEEYEEYLINLRKTNKKIVGVGEIGLDYSDYEYNTPHDLQQVVFVSQIKLAHELKLPIAMHIRDAHADALKLLNENKKYLTNGGILHCCSASAEEVEEYLNLGFYVSFSGTITYGKKNQEYYLEETLKAVPLDRLLIETDCPFLTPSPYRGRVNEPKFVLVTAEKIASVLNMTTDEILKITTANAERLLKFN